ncbi:hypothetical protein [Actinomadura nitritigenes]|uniref:hypothetical protein n=1 Tax=Actinomadura nitritigenes TaxID=134602 RepID=UPI003D92DD34
MKYAERYIGFTGKLSIPVLTLHTIGDPAGPVSDETAYRNTVDAAGRSAMLRQTFVHAAGHCTFTPAEVATAIRTLSTRIKAGHWPSTSPRSLTTVAKELDGEPAGTLGTARFVKTRRSTPLRPWDFRNWGGLPS